MLEHIANKQNESQMILASLNMGVIAYSSDGVLLLNNEAAMQILEEIPHNFQDFLDIYDVDQKLRSRMLLGNKQAEIDYTSNHKYYKMSLEERELGRNRPSGHIVVIQDISQQVREEEQRKEFVANVSHELKTPLTTIKTYSESLIDWGIDEKSRDAVKKDINKLYNGSLRMETLIDDLLLLSRIDGRAIYTRIEKMNLMPLVRSCVERMYTQ
ncbi:MAG TPA: histidine kinase dimerization/phospho-acceptor domain-containing protein, partial [Candidatus Eisenbacteria bacterium]|nr:histidine kinase dimerization/phospho-acceptor domain-containing protein [Candidatus Eisenbacteria bacterium]